MMSCRRPLLLVCLVVAVMSGFAPAHACATDVTDGARKFIQSLADRAVAALAVKEISREERIKRFHELLKAHFAIETMGRWVLGRHWQNATAEERTEYLKLFEDLIVITYVDRFADYSGEGLEVIDGSTRGDRYCYVSTRIKLPGADPLDVGWWVRLEGQDFKIFDVSVTGISMSQTQRDEFASSLRQNGGSISQFLDELRKRVGNRV